MPIAFLLAALALQSLPAPNLSRWEEFATEGGQNRLAVDPQSISRSGTRATLIVRAHMRQASGPVLAVMRYAYDCAANVVTREAGDIYSATGSFLGSVGAGTPNEAIPARSIQARFRDLACGAGQGQ